MAGNTAYVVTSVNMEYTISPHDNTTASIKAQTLWNGRTAAELNLNCSLENLNKYTVNLFYKKSRSYTHIYLSSA
jgi:hypothetical protein